MDYFIVVLASIAGGLVNYNSKKNQLKKPRGGHTKWLYERHQQRKQLAYNISIALVSVFFLIPPLVETFNFHPTLIYLTAFFIGYCGVRLLPSMEKKVNDFLNKITH